MLGPTRSAGQAKGFSIFYNHQNDTNYVTILEGLIIQIACQRVSMNLLLGLGPVWVRVRDFGSI